MKETINSKILKIALIDYIGYSDEKGNPIGHPLKVLKEYKKILSQCAEISVAAPSGYLAQVNSCRKIVLPFKVNAFKCDKSLLMNLKISIINFINIFVSVKKCKEPILWFYNINQVLFIYLLLFKCKKKIIITLYEKEFNRRIYNYILKKTIRKVHLILLTNAKTELYHKNCIYIPDYLYDKELYGKYRKRHKNKQIIMMGTMNDKLKEVLKVVEIFRDINYTLLICGKFYSMNCFENSINIKSENIIINNIYLDYKDYLSELSKSKFCILPYKMDMYKYKTSGVLLEAIFMNVIPIAPQALLDNLKIPGIGYEKLEDLTNIDFNSINTNNYYQQYNKLIGSVYSKEYFIKTLTNKLNDINK